MLVELDISNILLMENIKIEFKNGLTAITGQTGAGKSILIDSIAIILGKRAETGILRNKDKNGVIIATFKNKNDNLYKILNDNGFIDKKDDFIVIKKIITKNGSKILINDIQTTVQFVNKISNYLLEIYSQFEQIDIFDLKKHLEILDDFANSNNDILILKKLFLSSKEAEKKYNETKFEIEKQKKNLEYLKNLINDISALNIKDGEYDNLISTRSKMIEREKIATYIEQAYSTLCDTKIGPTINKVQNDLQHVLNIVNKDEDMKVSFSSINEELEEMYNLYQIIDEHLDDAKSKYFFEEEKINKIEERISSINEIARKYQTTPYELKNKFEIAKKELDEISISDKTLNNLSIDLNEKKQKYFSFANELSAKRKKAAKKLENIVSEKLLNLKMDKASFSISFENIEPTELGIDKVIFLASTNSGLPALPIHKIASGGELSRFMLAFKSAFCDKNNISTIIFDEIDTGVSGNIAFAIGKEMKKLSKNTQVICITHNSQVAAWADEHLLIKKKQNNDSTFTTVNNLTNNEKIYAIAEMISGDKITNEALKNAEILLKNAN